MPTDLVFWLRTNSTGQLSWLKYRQNKYLSASICYGCQFGHQQRYHVWCMRNGWRHWDTTHNGSPSRGEARHRGESEHFSPAARGMHVCRLTAQVISLTKPHPVPPVMGLRSEELRARPGTPTQRPRDPTWRGWLCRSGYCDSWYLPAATSYWVGRYGYGLFEDGKICLVENRSGSLELSNSSPDWGLSQRYRNQNELT